MCDNNDATLWIQIKATAKTEYLDSLTAVMSMISNSLMIEDYSDVEQELDGIYGDLIDEELLSRDRTVASVSVFVAAQSSPGETAEIIKRRFAELSLPVTIECIGVHEEDWADSWKKYYKPIKAGERLVIVPVWEDYTPSDGEVCVLMDPGMAFGTGTHETTRLCAGLLEKAIKPGDKMLDVGCGSGILAVCAAKLGAESCFACDLDPVAVRIARENAVLNNTPNITVRVSDLLCDVSCPDGGYNVICANIVADVIIRLAPSVGAKLSADGTLIVSGIIDERCTECREALMTYGFAVVDEVHENGWCALALRNSAY